MGSNDETSPWFETQYSKNGNPDDIEELATDVDTSREIREISVRISMGNAICALDMSDGQGESLCEVEWENFDMGREWKTTEVPAGYEVVGIQANTTNDENNITRLGFVLRKQGSN